MNHAILVNGEPKIFNGQAISKGDGFWSPVEELDNMSRAEKLEYGVYEVEPNPLGSGPMIESGPTLSLAPEGDRVLETTIYRAMTAQEIDANKTARVDAYDILGFRWSFDLENRLRAVESAIAQAAPAIATTHGVSAKPQVTQTEVRTALKARL